METLIQDIRYALRMMAKAPAFTAVAVLTLALGIGANTAIFTLINAVMLRMLPVQNVKDLVVIGDSTAAHRRSLGTPSTEVFSYPLYKEFRDQNTSFSGVMAAGEFHRVRVNRPTGESISDDVLGVLASGNYFSVLGVNAYLGRTLSADDDRLEGGHAVAVINYTLWKNRFDSDPAVVGSTIRLNNYPFTIIGVTPPGFNGQIVGDIQEVWVPLMMQAQVMPGRKWLDDPNASWLSVMAKLKPGVSVAQAKADVNVVFKRALDGAYGAKVDAEDKRSIAKQTIEVASGARGVSAVRGEVSKPLMLLMGIVGLVLLIACVNVANLLLARATSRQQEMGVRLALGAKPARLVRQLITESVLLAILGGAAGLLLAAWGTKLLLSVSGLTTEKTGLHVDPDWRVLSFTAVVCVVTGLLFGVVPALRALRVEMNGALKGGAQGGSSARGGFHWGKLLVGSQVALSVLVLFAAGLLVRSLHNLRNVDLGYSRDHLLMVRIDPVGAGYTDVAKSALVMTELRERLAQVPGVRSVSVSEIGFFSGAESATAVRVEGFTPATEDDAAASFDRVGPEYFTTLGVPLVSGRDIGPQDTASSQPVIVINESMAKFFFRDKDPIGRTVSMDDSGHKQKSMTVVGVARDIRHQTLDKPIERRFYMPMTQLAEPAGMMVFEIRTTGNPESLVNNVREAIRAYNSAIVVQHSRSLEVLVDRTISNEIIIAKLSTFFGALALTLACVGLYGVMSYMVAGRTREIGVRLALGAQRPNILGMVLREAMLLVGIGVLCGIPAAMAATRLINSMLYGLNSTDPLAMAVVVIVLATVAGLAAFIPARRATKIDPMVALRYE